MFGQNRFAIIVCSILPNTALLSVFTEFAPFKEEKPVGYSIPVKVQHYPFKLPCFIEKVKAGKKIFLVATYNMFYVQLVQRSTATS